jgi:glycosyltransferase involved in cell wall biosynthesis
MNVLFISNLFPNAAEPTRGMHNAQQVAALAKHCRVTEIIAPTYNELPREEFHGIPVVHPKFIRIPLLSRPFNGRLFARSVAPELQDAKFDIALVNWAYPDAYGVMLLADKSKFPFATTVQGSDVNIFFRNPTRKRQILAALRASRAVFTRSNALRDLLARDGVKATTVYNGIDREKFQPRSRAEACRALGLPENRRRILFVGNLLPVKGPTILARAFETICGSDFQSRPVGNTIPSHNQFDDVDLLFIGSGSESKKIKPSDRVKLLGAQPHDKIPLWMNACDVLCLPSLNEGLPNVALEALASALPVVASNVGGVPEIIRDGVNGLLVAPRNPDALAAALRVALTFTWDRSAVMLSVEKFDWEANAKTVVEILENSVRNSTIPTQPTTLQNV